jgi:hypothetical protein
LKPFAVPPSEVDVISGDGEDECPRDIDACLSHGDTLDYLVRERTALLSAKVLGARDRYSFATTSEPNPREIFQTVARVFARIAVVRK